MGARGAGAVERARRELGKLPAGGSDLGLIALALLLAAGSAQAKPLGFTGSLAIQIGGFGIGIPGHGEADLDSYGHLGSFAIGAGAFRADALTVTIPTSVGAAPVGGLQVTAQNGSGSFARPGGTMPILGVAKVCVFGPCSSALANLEVPLSVIGGPAQAAVTVEGAINVTVVGAPWTTGTAAVGTATAMGYARGPVSQTSSTARASGEIQLVTPILIRTNLPDDLAEIPAFGVLTLHFIPEPATLALLGAGLAAIAIAARRQRP